MKKILCLAMTMLTACLVWAAPMQRIKKTIQLTNGQTIEVYMCGDEDATYLMAADGRVAELEADGYVLRTFDGSQTQRRLIAARAEAPHRSKSTQSSAALRAIGSPHIAVVLVDFSDTIFHKSISSDNPIEKFQNIFHGTGSNAPGLTAGTGSMGSVRDYFRDQSRALFTPNFDVIGHIKVNGTHHSYASNRTGFRDEVLDKVSKMNDINWSDYDTDGDNKVDALIIIFAGTGHNTSGNSNDMHACCWDTPQTKNGVTFATTLIAPEMRGTVNTQRLNGIGVYCHEMSHMLGLPDFYDTSAPNDAPGMDFWDLMDYGEYCGDGTRPVGYSAYEKEYMGWITIPELTETQMLNMSSLPEGGTAYRYTNDANPDEYYIIEVRNKYYTEGDFYNWDETIISHKSYNLGGGLLVTHIDYSASLWNTNLANADKNHQRVIIIPANNHFELLDELNKQDGTGAKWLNELRGHTYPCKNVDAGWGVLGNNELSDNSTPAATLFNANTDGTKLMHKALFYIEQDEQDHITCLYSHDGDNSMTAISDTQSPSTLSTSYFLLDGRRAQSSTGGVVIMKQHLSDGTQRAIKVIK